MTPAHHPDSFCSSACVEIVYLLLHRLASLEERATKAEEAAEHSQAQAAEAQAAFEAASKEVAEVRERARALLEEKDAQLQNARVLTSWQS